jgi:predicted transcriptional regulator
MSSLKMITFRCPAELFRKLEHFAQSRSIDRTSALKLAIHYYLNKPMGH